MHQINYLTVYLVNDLITLASMESMQYAMNTHLIVQIASIRSAKTKQTLGLVE